MNYSVNKPTLDYPITHFNKKNGFISVSGRSIEVDSTQFWLSLKRRLIRHTKNSTAITSIRFQMDYLTSSSFIELLEFLEFSKSIPQYGNGLEVEWLYEEGDEDILELGNCIHDTLGLPVKCVQMN